MTRGSAALMDALAVLPISASSWLRHQSRLQRIRSEPVRADRAGQAVPDQKDDGSDHGNKIQQDEPARFVAVVKPANGYGQSGQEHCQGRNAAQQSELLTEHDTVEDL